MEKFNINSPARDIRTPLPHPFFHRKPSWLLGENSEWPLREQLPLTCLKSLKWFHRMSQNLKQDLSVSRNQQKGIRNEALGLPWWSHSEDVALPLQRAWVWSVVGELRSCMPWCGQNTEEKKKSSLAYC